jgi:hypothetical protein
MLKVTAPFNENVTLDSDTVNVPHICNTTVVSESLLQFFLYYKQREMDRQTIM